MHVAANVATFSLDVTGIAVWRSPRLVAIVLSSLSMLSTSAATLSRATYPTDAEVALSVAMVMIVAVSMPTTVGEVTGAGSTPFALGSELRIADFPNPPPPFSCFVGTLFLSEFPRLPELLPGLWTSCLLLDRLTPTTWCEVGVPDSFSNLPVVVFFPSVTFLPTCFTLAVSGVKWRYPGLEDNIRGSTTVSEAVTVSPISNPFSTPDISPTVDGVDCSDNVRVCSTISFFSLASTAATSKSMRV